MAFVVARGRLRFFSPAIAFVPMPDSMHLALVVERFDIRTGNEDQRLLALEDM